MTRHVMLNNIQHKNLRVITRQGAEFGDNVGTVGTFPTEFADIQREYPIFFRKDPKTGEYSAIALLGLAKDENLFLEGDRWDAELCARPHRARPFLIGFQEREEGGEVHREPMIHVDLDHPRVSETEGEALFQENGSNSSYLSSMVSVMRGINDGLAYNKAMFFAFTSLGLIEPLKLEIKLDAETQYELLGLHTISEQKLNSLSAEDLHRLHRSGFLYGAFLVLASMNNLGRLIERKLRRKARQAAMTS